MRSPFMRYIFYAVVLFGGFYLLSLLIGPFAYRLLNFFIIFALAVYFIQKKLLPDVKNKIVKKQSDIQDLKHESKRLLGLQNELEQEIQDQELLSKHLFDQIKIWSRFFDKECEEQEKTQELFVNRSKERFLQQKTVKSLKRMKDVVFSKALDDARIELEQLFASEQEGRRFTQTIIEFMRKDGA